MEFSVDKKAFLEELTLVQGVVEARSTIPILSNLLLKAEKGQVLLASTDLELSMKAWMVADVSATGAVTVQARRLFDIVRSLPDSKVTVKTEET